MSATDENRLAEIEARAITALAGIRAELISARLDVPWLCEQLRRATDHERLAKAVVAALEEAGCLALSGMADATDMGEIVAAELRAAMTVAKEQCSHE